MKKVGSNRFHFSGVMSTDTSATTQLVQRCVIITRDDNGYGLTVSGFNPVFVQSVKEGRSIRQGAAVAHRSVLRLLYAGLMIFKCIPLSRIVDGAAARAGVRQGDRIIKVNGTLVREANHMDVVKMISNCKSSNAIRYCIQPEPY